jgi:penicillin-binding protein-related factor A (putative recombinase)
LLQDWRTDYIARGGKEGKEFEAAIEYSCEKQNLFFFRVRDVDHTALKRGRSVPKNKYDSLIFTKGRLFTVELKSNQKKSISFGRDDADIKPHQIESLTKDLQREGVIPGLLLNYRTYDNRTYFIHIKDFNDYLDVASGKKESTYKSKVNEKSIPLDIAAEIGTPVGSFIRRTKYGYYINKMCDDLIKKYS